MHRLGIVFSFLLAISVANADPWVAANNSWSSTKRAADQVIHKDDGREFYCGCDYRSNNTSSGSGVITSLTRCGYQAPASNRSRAARIEWEHIVPASLMPARRFQCWSQEGGSRTNCERTSARARTMIFDLHNLVPAIGQANALRGNDRYAELPNIQGIFGACPIKDTRGRFEPADCKKGDVARVWLYMEQKHRVVIPPSEREMFLRWSERDPVSPWESKRQRGF